MSEVIVLVTGGFDPIHSGHIAYLKDAKKLGAIYVISKYDLNFYGLKLLCDDCSKHVKLYLIE